MQRMSDVMTYVTVIWLRSEQNIVWNELALIKRMYILLCYLFKKGILKLSILWDIDGPFMM